MRACVLSVFLFLCLLLPGCDRAAIVDKIASTQEQAFAREQVERLRTRQFATIEASLDTSIARPEVRGALEKMAAMVPAGEPRSVETVAAQKLHKANGTTYLSTTTEYAFAKGWLLAHVLVAETDGKRTITGFNVFPRTQSLAEEHRFTLAGKGILHYVFLAGAFAALVVTVYALVACVRTRQLRRKWLWIPFILVGVGQFALNWTAGDVHAQALYLQLFSAGVRAQLGAPWFVSLSIPLGAIVFLWHARKRRTAD